MLHDFANQLDQENGDADGVPELPRRGMYTAWGRVLAVDFHELVAESAEGRAEVLDAYGATNPAEFFAVATETFFERPRALAAEHPALYEQLELYDQQDPALLAPPVGSVGLDREDVVG